MKYTEFLEYLHTCPFCDSSRIILENNTAFLTYSIAPYHPDHLLVGPKRHIEHLLDLTTQELIDIDALQKQALIILEHLGYKNISILVRDGKDAGKSIDHLHYNIIPNTILGNSQHGGGDRVVLSDAEIAVEVLRLKSAI